MLVVAVRNGGGVVLSAHKFFLMRPEKSNIRIVSRSCVMNIKEY